MHFHLITILLIQIILYNFLFIFIIILIINKIMSLKVHEMIKKIRACKTAEEERSVINKESAEMRNLSKVYYKC